MHYTDYVSESRNRSYQNGEGGEIKPKLGYRRDVAFLAGDAINDTFVVPDTFIDRYGGQDVGAQLRYGQIEYTWEDERNYGSDYPVQPAQWRVTKILISGYMLKKDGTPGQRDAGKRFYLGSDISPPPDWLVQIVTKFHPAGDENPFPEEIQG